MGFSSPLTGLIVAMVGIAIMATVIGMFQRETTFVDTKYIGNPWVEIDASYTNPLEGPHYSGNNSSGGTGGVGMSFGNDADFDGLDNAQEFALGTNPNDPDTDNDGVSDGTEVALNTDPQDPESGGLFYISYPPFGGGIGGGDGGGDKLPTDKLLLGAFNKQVRNLTKGEAVWKDATNADFGDTVSFRIQFELTNPSTTATLSALVIDNLGKGLQYIDDSGWIKIMNESPKPLPPLWVMGHLVEISPELNPQKPVPIEITFNSQVVHDPFIQNMSLTVNQVLIKILDKLVAMDSAIVRFNK